jgi:hypothetical protein
MYGLQWFINSGQRSNKKGVYEKYSTLFFGNNSYNALVLGSSRAEMHTDVALLDSLTGLISYNAGVSGATTRMAYVVLKSYLVNSTIPKTIFLECDFHISHLKTDTIFNFPRYFPYLTNEVLFKGFKDIDPRFTRFRYNPFYSLPYSGINALSPALHGWTGTSGAYDEAYHKGFFKNTEIDHYDHFNTSRYDGYIHKETRQYLDSIILFCKDNSCQLIFMMSPAYKNAQKEVKNKGQIIEQYRNIAFIHHIPVFEHSNDTDIVNHRDYFEDNYHMLYSGARLYTLKIAADFNNIPR